MEPVVVLLHPVPEEIGIGQKTLRFGIAIFRRFHALRELLRGEFGLTGSEPCRRQ